MKTTGDEVILRLAGSDEDERTKKDILGDRKICKKQIEYYSKLALFFGMKISWVQFVNKVAGKMINGPGGRATAQ